MRKITLIILIFILFHYGFSQNNKPKTPIQYVNPFIGTERMGHTYPGATVPFGSVQLSPETDTILMYDAQGKYNASVYQYCGGYQYTDPTIVGFSHTHFSGTGHSDLGDILIMPSYGTLQLNPGTAVNPESGYRSTYYKNSERAEPNYYRVQLKENNINVELTTTARVGIHRYTFPQTDSAHIILDLNYGIYNYEGKNVWTYLRVVNDTLITGYRITNGWAKNRTVYFAISFSKKINNYGYQLPKEKYQGFWRRFDIIHNFPDASARELKAYFDFETGDPLLIKVAISPVSTEGAILNMLTETPTWDFDFYKKQGQEMWNMELSKIWVETLTEEEKVNFYTSLYHAFLGPTIYMDVDRRYKGLDQNIHQADTFINYTSYSLWDTYRGLHPLFTIIQPTREKDMILSMLAHFDQNIHCMLPVWSHYGNENWCMIGYHSVSVIADAYVKGIRGFDPVRAFRACERTANNNNYDGLKYYKELGFVPEDKSSNSASKTLEFAYDDWCIAQFVMAMNNKQINNHYPEYLQRSQNYTNLYDPSTGFIRPKTSNGQFVAPFDPLDTHGQGFIEGNAWNYSLYVPHDIPNLVKLMGGKKKFEEYLDSLFTMELPDQYFENTEDVTRDGIIGNYVHGNEPSHQSAFLYHWTNSPWKSQEKVRMILKRMYHPKPSGLSGNDDFGQMSAWYVFNAMGFYPVCPGSELYYFGSPSLVKATLQLENGKSFIIRTVNQSEENIYIQKIEFNGRMLNTPYLRHSDLIQGGELIFYMGAKPQKQYFNKLCNYLGAKI
jgi:predicted alpha-1,2-mannosidase